MTFPTKDGFVLSVNFTSKKSPVWKVSNESIASFSGWRVGVSKSVVFSGLGSSSAIFFSKSENVSSSLSVSS